MSTNFEMKLIFEDSKKPIILKNRDLLLKCPVLIRIIESENPNWKTTEYKVSTPLEVPFPKSAGQFLFKYCQKYEVPDPENHPNIEEYKEANEKSVEELIEIIHLSIFLECDSFLAAIGFVVAKKMDVMPDEEIAYYFGVDYDESGHILDDADEFAPPPVDPFRNNANAQTKRQNIPPVNPIRNNANARVQAKKQEIRNSKQNVPRTSQSIRNSQNVPNARFNKTTRTTQMPPIKRQKFESGISFRYS